MTFLDAEDRRHLAMAINIMAPTVGRWLVLVVTVLLGMLVFAVTAGVAVQLFRLTSGW